MSNTESSAGAEPYQVGTGDVSTAVVEAVAATLDVDLFELPPLGSTIDTDALNGIWNSMYGERRPGYISLTFSYAGCHIAVEDGESVRVTTPEDR